jgi:hypothetical protein
MTRTTSCPICRGEIHSIAGRCKHCKADLVELRDHAARAARAQALGATVPPPPPGRLAPPAPWPPPGAPPPAAQLDFAPPATGESSQGPTLVDRPGEAALFAQAYSPSRHAPPAAAAPYGLGFAGARAHRLSTWSRRWPFLVGAVALLAIGASIGVLAERWRQREAGRADRGARHSEVSRRPVQVPDHMPLPLLPAPSLPPSSRDQPPASPPPASPPPSAAPSSPGPDPDPDARERAKAEAPDPSNPGSRFSPPPPSVDPGKAASAYSSFTAAFTDSLCEKLTQCGLIDSATQSICRAFGKELDRDDAADKVARGECSFNQKAADACLRAVADLRCDVSSSDRLMDWLIAQNQVGECAEAYACR